MNIAYVTVPFAGHISVAVEFDGPQPKDDDLIEMAMNVAYDASYGFQPDPDATEAQRKADRQIEPCEWEYHRKMIEGNFVYISAYEASVDQIEMDDAS